MAKKITVGMAEYRVSEGSDILESLGIGSCVVICLYCNEKKIGGLAHIMLDYANDRKVNPLRFSDKAIDALLGDLLFRGCKKESLVAKIFGGSSMFSNLLLGVGKKNVMAVRRRLKKEGIEIVSSDIGGKRGRSISFDISNGSVIVKKVRCPSKIY